MGSFQTSTFQPNSRLTRSRRAGSLTGAGAVVVAIAYSVIQRQARGGGPAFARRSRLRLRRAGEVEDSGPGRGAHRRRRRLGRGLGRDRPLEQRLQRQLAVVADDPDGSRLADAPLEAVPLAAVLTSDGDPHCDGSVPRLCDAPSDRTVAPPPTRCYDSTTDSGGTLATIAVAMEQTRPSEALGAIAFTGGRPVSRRQGPPAALRARTQRHKGDI